MVVFGVAAVACGVAAAAAAAQQHIIMRDERFGTREAIAWVLVRSSGHQHSSIIVNGVGSSTPDAQ